MRATTTVFLATVAGLTLVANSPAQTTGAGRSRVCLQGAPANRCAVFAIAEAGAHLRLTDHLPGEKPLLVNYALGFMVNRGARTAVGAAVFAGYEEEIRGGVALRVRRWIGPHAGLDVAAGVHLFGSLRNSEFQCIPGFTGSEYCGGSSYAAQVVTGSPMLQARLGYRDLMAVTARLDVLGSKGGHQDCGSGACVYQSTSRTSGRLYVGAELGAQAGLTAQALTAAAVLVGGLVFLASWDGPFGDMHRMSAVPFGR